MRRIIWWLLPPDLARKIGLELGRTYPAPMLDHALARERAIAFYSGHGRRGSPGK